MPLCSGRPIIAAIEEARDDTREGCGTVGDMVLTMVDEGQQRHEEIMEVLGRIEAKCKGMGAGSKSRRSKRRKPKKGKKGKKGKSKRRRRSRNN